MSQKFQLLALACLSLPLGLYGAEQEVPSPAGNTPLAQEGALGNVPSAFVSAARSMIDVPQQREELHAPYECALRDIKQMQIRVIESYNAAPPLVKKCYAGAFDRTLQWFKLLQEAAGEYHISFQQAIEQKNAGSSGIGSDRGNKMISGEGDVTPSLRIDLFADVLNPEEEIAALTEQEALRIRGNHGNKQRYFALICQTCRYGVVMVNELLRGCCQDHPAFQHYFCGSAGKDSVCAVASLEDCQDVYTKSLTGRVQHAELLTRVWQGALGLVKEEVLGDYTPQKPEVVTAVKELGAQLRARQAALSGYVGRQVCSTDPMARFIHAEAVEYARVCAAKTVDRVQEYLNELCQDDFVVDEVTLPSAVDPSLPSMQLVQTPEAAPCLVPSVQDLRPTIVKVVGPRKFSEEQYDLVMRALQLDFERFVAEGAKQLKEDLEGIALCYAAMCSRIASTGTPMALANTHKAQALLQAKEQGVRTIVEDGRQLLQVIEKLQPFMVTLENCPDALSKKGMLEEVVADFVRKVASHSKDPIVRQAKEWQEREARAAAQDPDLVQRRAENAQALIASAVSEQKKPKQQQTQPTAQKKRQESPWYDYKIGNGKMSFPYPKSYALSSNILFEVYGLLGQGLSASYNRYFVPEKGDPNVVPNSKVPEGAVILPDAQAKAKWQNAKVQQRLDLAILATKQRHTVRLAEEAARDRDLAARRAVVAVRGFAAVAADLSPGGALPMPTSEAKVGKASPKKKRGGSKHSASMSPTSPRSPSCVHHISVHRDGSLADHLTRVSVARGSYMPSGLHADGGEGLLGRFIRQRTLEVVGIGRINLLTSREELQEINTEKRCFRIEWGVEGGRSKVSDCWPLDSDWTLPRIMDCIEDAARHVTGAPSAPDEDGIATYLGVPRDCPAGACGIRLMTRNDPSGTPVLVSAWPVLAENGTEAL